MMSTTNRRFAAELVALRPTRRSRIGLRTEGDVMMSTTNRRFAAELVALRRTEGGF